MPDFNPTDLDAIVNAVVQRLRGQPGAEPDLERLPASRRTKCAGSRRSRVSSGLGFDLVAELENGEHAITVTAPDGLGGTLEERGIIIVGG